MSNGQIDSPEGRSEIVLYQTEDGQARIQVRLDGGTVWLSQALIAELFQVTPQNVTLHIKSIYEENELVEAATCKEYLQVQKEGDRDVQRNIKFYNLDMILSVGYRVRSPRGIQFRRWASERLGEYIVKGFTMDDERLKGTGGLVDYFDELLKRIRDIRASEARVYLQIREIFKLASDYRADETETQSFFAKVQNKIIYAATEQTAAELVRARADALKPNMGLTTWKGKVVRKQDVLTAKNYLDAKEIDTLNRVTVMFLDQAEFRAQRRQDIHMADWDVFLERFLSQTELPVLDHPGRISHQQAEEWSHSQYDQFEERRRQEADAAAEARYVEDLKQTAKMLEEGREQRESKPKSTRPVKRTSAKRKDEKNS